MYLRIMKTVASNLEMTTRVVVHRAKRENFEKSGFVMILVSFMRVNGVVIIKMGKESSNGRMVLCIQVNGSLDILKAMVSLLKPMEMFLKGSGIEERLMVLLVTSKKGRTVKLVILILVNGKMERSMAKVKRVGLMVPTSRASIKTTKNMVPVP